MPKGPELIGDILAQLMARRGFARVESAAALDAAWCEAVGELAQFTRVGAVRRGKLEVTVANSTVLQELTFRKTTLLNDLVRLLPDDGIQDVRFRTGRVN